tara:strand:+ start:295 stop:441 length:147 start_codon:yes stop_codon:yes gene_type:complete
MPWNWAGSACFSRLYNRPRRVQFNQQVGLRPHMVEHVARDPFIMLKEA